MGPAALEKGCASCVDDDDAMCVAPPWWRGGRIVYIYLCVHCVYILVRALCIYTCASVTLSKSAGQEVKPGSVGSCIDVNRMVCPAPSHQPVTIHALQQCALSTGISHMHHHRQQLGHALATAQRLSVASHSGYLQSLCPASAALSVTTGPEGLHHMPCCDVPSGAYQTGLHYMPCLDVLRRADPTG
jgi:hypothetical protein